MMARKKVIAGSAPPSEEDKSMSKVARILKIIEFLQKDWCTILELEKNFPGVSERTIQRDILDIQKCLGEPLQKSFKKGYRLLSDQAKYFLSLDLTCPEAMAVYLLCQRGRGVGAIPYLESVESALCKLRCLFPEKMRENLWSAERIEFRALPVSPGEHRSCFQEILAAMEKGYAVRLEYDSIFDGCNIQTTVMPYRMHFTKHTWYVTGRSSLHQDVRTFHLERIRELTPMPDALFVIPIGWNYDEFVGNAWNMIRGPQDYDVHLRFSKRVARNVSSVLWHKTCRFVKNPDGTVDMYATVSGFSEIVWWILGYGEHVEVLSPPELRDEIRRHIERMVEIY